MEGSENFIRISMRACQYMCVDKGVAYMYVYVRRNTCVFAIKGLVNKFGKSADFDT